VNSSIVVQYTKHFSLQYNYGNLLFRHLLDLEKIAIFLEYKVEYLGCSELILRLSLDLSNATTGKSRFLPPYLLRKETYPVSENCVLSEY
jgi:hypothetical protein